ncbi:hypothetical protein ABK040_015868 [Willaertia magna]
MPILSFCKLFLDYNYCDIFNLLCQSNQMTTKIKPMPNNLENTDSLNDPQNYKRTIGISPNVNFNGVFCYIDSIVDCFGENLKKKSIVNNEEHYNSNNEEEDYYYNEEDVENDEDNNENNNDNNDNDNNSNNNGGEDCIYGVTLRIVKRVLCPIYWNASAY